MNKRDIAFIDVREEAECTLPSADGGSETSTRFCDLYRKEFKGTWMTGFKYTLETADYVIQNGISDLVCFGEAFIANADLVERF